MPQNDFSVFNSILDCLYFGNIFAFFILSFFYFLPVFNLLKQVTFIKNINIYFYVLKNQLFLKLKQF